MPSSSEFAIKIFLVFTPKETEFWMHCKISDLIYIAKFLSRLTNWPMWNDSEFSLYHDQVKNVLQTQHKSDSWIFGPVVWVLII